jgi:tetratricopeptide (TPR) repeat protein
MRFFLVALVALAAAVGPVSATRAASIFGACGDAKGDEQIEACTHIINDAKSSFGVRVGAHLIRGEAYNNKGDFDRAIADMSEVIRSAPEIALAYNHRCWAYGAKGEYDRAMADCNEAIRRDPKMSYAYNNRGNLFRFRRDFDRAISDYSEAIRLKPELANAFYNRGYAKRAKGDSIGGNADVAAAKKLDPTLPD